MKRAQRIPVGGSVAIAMGVVGLVILGILLDRERLTGGMAWTLITAYGMYRFGLWLAGPHLLPIEPDRESRRSARDLLQRFANGQKTLMAVVREGKVLPGPGGKPRAAADGEGALLVDSTSVAALVTDTGLSRIKGPGVHFTRRGERIGAVVDLRPQARSKEIEAQTRDGIGIKFKVNARFQVDGTEAQKVQSADRTQVRWPAPYTWSPRQVTRVLGLQRAGIDQPVSWDEIVLNEAIQRAHTHIAGYTFDELTEPRNPSVDRREDIRKSLEAELKSALAGSGIKVLGIKLSQFVPRDKEVDRQRFETWQAEWIRRKTIIEAEGVAESYRLVELARAQGQMEMVTRITQALDAGRQAGLDNADLVALRLLEVVERLAAEPRVRERLTGEAREALSQVQRKLLSGGSSGGLSPSA